MTEISYHEIDQVTIVKRMEIHRRCHAEEKDELWFRLYLVDGRIIETETLF